jgi:hypothetical protein
MAVAARERAARYSWPDLAREVLGIYEGLVGTAEAAAR